MGGAGNLLAAPSAADPDTRDQVERWLRSTYELESPSAITR